MRLRGTRKDTLEDLPRKEEERESVEVSGADGRAPKGYLDTSFIWGTPRFSQRLLGPGVTLPGRSLPGPGGETSMDPNRIGFHGSSYL